ncbi:MAG: VOC family protein [Tepidiformaceae bacterium]
MVLKRLDNIGIAVADIKRAIAFYTGPLGLEGQANDADGTVTIGDLSFYVFETSRKADSPPVGRSVDLYADPVGIDHLSFEVDDIDTAGAELESRGITFGGDIVGAPGEFRYRGFSDPDGNMLYIIQKP